MLKTYQFKTQCKGDIHSSKTANIILPGLTWNQRWTTLRNVVGLGYSTWVGWVVSTEMMQFNESEYHFACSNLSQARYVPVVCWASEVCGGLFSAVIDSRW